MRSVYRDQKILETVISRSRVSWDITMARSRDMNLTFDLIRLHDITMDILKICRVCIEKGVDIMRKLEWQLKRMDRLEYQVNYIRDELASVQRYFSKWYVQLFNAFCCGSPYSAPGHKYVERLRHEQVEEVEKERAIEDVVSRKYASADQPSTRLRRTLDNVKKEYANLGVEIENNIMYARHFVKVVRDIFLGISLELRLQNQQIPLLRESIVDVISDIKEYNEMNEDIHDV